MVILLHTSKTMRSPRPSGEETSKPALINKASELAAYVASLDVKTIAKVMHVSPSLAVTTKQVLTDWSLESNQQSLAIDSFVGDIYSGLQAASFSASERLYANQHLRILSGLYGILRPFDGIRPYRLEMGYRFPDTRYKDLYAFWGDDIARQLPAHGLIMNLTAMEYAKTVLPFVDASRVVTPKFLTVSPKTGQPEFVVVHAKIARGAFARWLITTKTTDIRALEGFADIGYRYEASLSQSGEPVFVCQEFGGKGFSVRLAAG